MNQGSAEEFQKYNGVSQDGGMLIHLPSEDRWVAIFLAFQSQCWHTDDESGNCIGDVDQPAEDKGIVIITLLNSGGLKIQGVQYNKSDVTEQGRTIAF